VTIAFLWQLVGSLLDSPRGLLDLTPFAHVGLAPTQRFRTVAALAMIAIGSAARGVAIALFIRRDLLAD
jgi:ABC-2 type transport system permease protein